MDTHAPVGLLRERTPSLDTPSSRRTTPREDAEKQMEDIMNSPMFLDRMTRMIQQQTLQLPPFSPQTDRDHPGPVHMPVPPRRANVTDQEMEARAYSPPPPAEGKPAP